MATEFDMINIQPDIYHKVDWKIGPHKQYTEKQYRDGPLGLMNHSQV